MSIQGIVFNIQKFCINDGPGIRTTVFFKGCPLDCAWCHNPESKEVRREILLDPRKCIGCGACREVCINHCHADTYDRTQCQVCGACAEQCPSGALSLVGENKSIEELMSEILRDRDFYNSSGGGLTVSGGEPMMQFEFMYEFLKAARDAGLHICMETCGYADSEQYIQIAPLVDIFLFDYKITDPLTHEKYIGASNELIHENLRLLDSLGSSIILRCPIIPTVNDNEEHFKGIAAMANELQHVMEINIEPYHPLGSGKSAMLGKSYSLGELTFPDNEVVENWMQQIQQYTKIPVIKA